MKKRFYSGILAGGFLILSGSSAFAAWGRDYGMGPGSHMMGGGYMGWTMILFWILVLVLLVSLVRWVLGLADNRGPRQTPLDILKERLARGDIDSEEFERKRQML